VPASKGEEVKEGEMEKPKTKSDVIRAWLKEYPKGTYGVFCAEYPDLEVSRSLWSHVSKSRSGES
jgi:hypothetical protein